MKTRIVCLVVVGMLMGCQSHQEMKVGSASDLSDFAKKYLGLNNAAGLSMSSAQNSMMSGSAGAMNKSLSSAGVSFSSGAVTSASGSTIDSTSTCGVATTTQNPDGSTTYIYDYGDSCVQTYDFGKYIYWGKSSSTYKYTTRKEGSVYINEYFSNSQFKNFGGKYISKDYNSWWNSNGYYKYSGESTYDTLSQEYSGWSESSDSSAFSYNDGSYVYEGSGKYSYNNKKSVEESNEYRYINGENYYHSVVTVPVVRDYTCNPYQSKGNGIMPLCIVLVPVSGRVLVDYSQDGKSGEFEIDYGNGECDTLITITENGKTIIVDLMNLYQEVMTAKAGG